MTVTLDLDTDTSEAAARQAQASGVPLEQYLPALIAQGVRDAEHGAARLTMLASEPVLRRLWETPEEDEAWKDL